MPATLKKRLLFITTTIMSVFILLILTFVTNSFYTHKMHTKSNLEMHVAYTAEKIENTYDLHHAIVNEFSEIASVFYKSHNYDKDILISTIKNNYKDRLPNAGVGIWYDEYSLIPDKKWFCVFAYKDKENNVVFNDTLENDEYNYINKNWFTYIKSQATKGVKYIYIPTTCSAAGEKNYVITMGTGIYADGKMVGIITGDWLITALNHELEKYKPTPNSYLLLADTKSDFIVAFTKDGNKSVGKSLKTLSWYKDSLKSDNLIKDDKKLYVTFPIRLESGLLLIVNVPADELYGDVYGRFFIITLLLIIFLVAIQVIMQNLLTKNVNKPVQYLVNMAEKIGNGDLDAKLEIKEPEEFVQLANAFNKMTTDIQDYITNINQVTAEKDRMEAELSIAHSIQAASLPTVFPPYPDRKEFDVYADMIPAKEVGGDFYDFFFVDKNNFIILIADVSGKGVPAALFMMGAKTMLRNIIKTGIPLDEAITKVNHKICKNNKQGYFITAFIAKINLENGETTFINAGHNPPLLKRARQDYSYIKIETNLPLGAIDKFVYKKVDDSMAVGDELFLYTDGVTEATNKDLQLYGETRLIETLNKNKEIEIEQVIPTVKQNVSEFVNGEKQSDDMTNLVFRYNGIEFDTNINNSEEQK